MPAHDSTHCPICRGQPVNGSMSDPAFAGFLGASRAELGTKQAAFRGRIAGAARWHYDLDAETLEIGGTVFGLTLVGSFNPGRQTWLWAWANADFPARAREAAGRVRGLHAVTGFQIFLDPGLEASRADAEDLVAMAVHHLGALGCFPSPSETHVLFLAVHAPLT